MSNIKERNEQVMMMGAIYRNAAEVLTWINQKHKSFDMVGPRKLIVFRPWKSTSAVLKALVKQSLPTEDEMKFLNVIRQDEYWRRAWVLQEQLLAQKVIVFNKSHRMSRERLAEVLVTTHDR
ncbi:hypothetical protein H2198_010089 [Neophaeococcomyces mojaviensis]|uniref:Uncharacterized protein n=1 Tax=Neophaeococcomyces mojaviensis TaxID=3383035 RepID=A0ACC2ZSP2_9EURO|nr:hypothetical protein H2198_010089 [Knufia sp. JES_112]